MALTLGEQGDKHVRARHLVAAGILHMQHGALYDALEPRRRLGVLAVLDDKGQQLLIDIFLQRLPQRIDLDIAGLHHLGRIGIVHERKKQMLERRVFVMPVARELDRAMQGLFQTTRERGHPVLLFLHGAL